MKKFHFYRCVQILAAVSMLGLLAACGGFDQTKKGTSAAVQGPASFDLTVAADKDGQFDLDGATLTREDLSGHIRYLSEVGKPVHTLLLIPGEKEHIKDAHVTALAGICRDLHITGYVRSDDSSLKIIKIDDTK